MALTNRQLRKQLKDALADQRGVVSGKIAAALPLSASEIKFLKNALADQSGILSRKLGLGIGEADGTEIQQIRFSNAPNFGVFKLNYGLAATANINYNDTAAQIETKLQAVTGLEDVVVTGSIAGNNLAVIFYGVAGDVSPLTVSDSTLTIAAIAATATLDLTADIVLTSVAAGTARNTNTFTLQVLAAAANPTDTVLVAFTGTAAAIICTVTPNDGTNNSAVPVNLTTAELRELITTGSVVGKTVTLTDASSRRVLQTATGGGATPLADAGEGDGVVATFAGGVAAIATTITDSELSAGSLATLSVREKAILEADLADQSGELVAAIAAGTDFSS